MPDKLLFDFLVPLATREGAWVIEPAAYHNSDYIHNLLSGLRTAPARIASPPGQNRYRFAERGEHGRWIFVWVPE